MDAALPPVLPGHWTTPDGHEMATRYAAMTRAELGNAHSTDLELANDIFMVERHSFRLIGLQTAAKERIRWLSAQLALARVTAWAWSADMSTAPEQFDDTYFLVRPRGIHPGRGGAFVPTVVTRLGNELFLPENHIDAVQWAKNGDVGDGPTTNMLEADLEWCPLP